MKELLEFARAIAATPRPIYGTRVHAAWFKSSAEAAAIWDSAQALASAHDPVAIERERCARICDAANNHDNPMTARDCADAIRSGETP